MLAADLIDRIDNLITQGLAIARLKPHLIDARDQATAIDKTVAQHVERITTLEISLEAQTTRNSALVASKAELEERYAQGTAKAARDAAAKARRNVNAQQAQVTDEINAKHLEVAAQAEKTIADLRLENAELVAENLRLKHTPPGEPPGRASGWG